MNSINVIGDSVYINSGSISVEILLGEFLEMLSVAFKVGDIYPEYGGEKPEDTDEEFRPNDITVDDVDQLDGWRLLVSCCHFAPQMRDCVEFDYAYTVKDGEIYTQGMSLADEISPTEPLGTAYRYCDFRINSWLRAFLRGQLDETTN